MFEEVTWKQFIEALQDKLREHPEFGDQTACVSILGDHGRTYGGCLTVSVNHRRDGASLEVEGYGG